VAGRKQFSDVRLASGETLLEAIVRLREEAMQQGVFVLALGFDTEKNFFAGGYVPLTDDKLIELLFDFIGWVGRKEASEEKSTPPAVADKRYS
jgi:hypothetical protein